MVLPFLPMPLQWSLISSLQSLTISGEIWKSSISCRRCSSMCAMQVPETLPEAWYTSSRHSRIWAILMSASSDTSFLQWFSLISALQAFTICRSTL